MNPIFIQNGKVVLPQSGGKWNILIENGLIKEIGEHVRAPQNAKIVDAAGKFIFPGFIDAHTHMGIPIRGTRSADDFDSGTLAAMHGGVTTVMDFTVQEPGESLMHSLERRMQWAKGNARVDYAFHCNVTHLDESALNEIPEIVRKGVMSFKAFTAYREAGMQLNDRQMMDLLWAVKHAGGTVMVHAENGDMVSFLTDRFVAQNNISAPFHAHSRPPQAEIEAVSRVLTLNQFIQCPLYFVHLTTTEAVQMIFMAHENGQPVYMETCPQYLMFDKSVYEQEKGYRFIAAPAFREKSDVAYLWQSLNQRVMHVVGSDHCPFTLEQKDRGNGAFHLTPNGLPGVETLFSILYSEGSRKGRLPLRKLISLISEEPARLFGLYPQKGTLLSGSDADLVIFNPQGSGRISAANLHSAVDWSPYEGVETIGNIEYVMLRGSWLIRDGKQVGGARGFGQFVPALL